MPTPDQVDCGPACRPCPPYVCFVERCCLCIPLKVSCLVLGYLQAVVSGVMCIWIFVDSAVRMLFHNNYWNGVVLLGYLTGVMLTFGLALLFAALLLHGVHKGKAVFVLLYFMYGVVVAILLGMSIPFGFSACNSAVIGCIMLCGLVLYIHLLVGVFSTYRSLRMKPMAKETFEEDDAIPPMYHA